MPAAETLRRRGLSCQRDKASPPLTDAERSKVSADLAAAIKRVQGAARSRAEVMRATAALRARTSAASAARARRRGDRLDRAARLAGLFRDLGVLLGDDRLGRLVAVVAAERRGRNRRFERCVPSS